MDVSASAGSPCPQFSVKRMEPPSVVRARRARGRGAARVSWNRQVLALPSSTKVEKEVAWGRGGG